jgi:hypothetical protein
MNLSKMTKQISSLEFFEYFKKNENTITIDDSVIEGDIIINSKDCICSSATISNCKFTGRVIFTGIKNNFSGLAFMNCDFEKSLEFHDVIFNKTDKDISALCKGIAILSSTIKESFVIKKSTIHYEIALDECKIGKIVLRSVQSKTGSLILSNIAISDSITISQVHTASEFRISKSIIKGWVKVENLFSGFYVFQENVFEARLMIWAGSAKGGITFNNGIYNEEVKIESVVTTGGLTIAGDEFKKTFLIKYIDTTNHKAGGPQSYYLNSCSFENGLIVDGAKDILEKSEIKVITIPSSNKMSGLIHFKGLIIKELVSITGVNKSAHLIFENVQLQELKIEYFTNFGKIQFIDVRSSRSGSSKLLVLNSDLGKTSFHNTFLDSFSDVDIINTTVTDISSSYVRWFDPLQILNKSKEEYDYGRNRDLFRQLKFAMFKQGDRVQALFFKKYEMLALKNELSKSKGRFNEKIMMWLNKSNDYGQDWFRPIWLGFLFSVILYIFLIIAVAPELSTSLSFKIEDLIRTFNVIPRYLYVIFKLLNPTHLYLSLIPAIRDNWLGNLIDFLQRVIISYFIFQTISAFRKYIKE